MIPLGVLVQYWGRPAGLSTSGAALLVWQTLWSLQDGQLWVEPVGQLWLNLDGQLWLDHDGQLWLQQDGQLWLDQDGQLTSPVKKKKSCASVRTPNLAQDCWGESLGLQGDGVPQWLLFERTRGWKLQGPQKMPKRSPEAHGTAPGEPQEPPHATPRALLGNPLVSQ